MYKSWITFLILSWFSFGTLTWAAPSAFNYGGRLVGASGKPIVGPVDLQIKFFDDDVAGTQVGPTKTYNDVVLKDGVFQVDIQLTAAERDTVFGGSAVYIEVTDLGSGKKYPRQTFGAVPYALRVPVDNTSIGYNAAGELEIQDMSGVQQSGLTLDGGANDVGIQAAPGTDAYDLILPDNAGNSGYVLTTNGAGVLDWMNIGALGGGDMVSTNNLSELTDYTVARSNLGLTVGTDVQAFDAQLTDVAGLTPSDNNIIIGNGANFVAESGATARTSLGVAIGSDVQGYDAQLADIAGLTPSDNSIIIGNGSNFVTESGATAHTSLGLQSMATQAAGSVAITGGTITGVTFSNFASTGIDDNADATAMTIDSTEQVGIGTASPATRVHVNGGDMTVGDQANTARSLRMRRNGTDVGGLSTTNNVLSLFGGASPASHLAIDGGGLVGIGTTGPTSLLDVNGGDLTVGDTTATDRSIRLRRSGTTIGGLSTTNSVLSLFGGAAAASHLAVASDGKVGIGTNAPSNLLTVSAASTATLPSSAGAPLALSNPDTTVGNTALISFRTVDTGATQVVGAKIGAVFPTHGVGTTTGELTFLTASSSASVNEVMRMTSAGNVGIGTTTPDTALEVTGQIVTTLPTTLVPAGTVQTVNLHNGNTQVIDLSSATGDVTLTLTNPVAGGNYALKIIQGATPRNLIWPASVKWPGGIPITVSDTAGAIDLVTMVYDGTSFLAVAGQSFQ